MTAPLTTAQAPNTVIAAASPYWTATRTATAAATSAARLSHWTRPAAIRPERMSANVATASETGYTTSRLAASQPSLPSAAGAEASENTSATQKAENPVRNRYR